MHFDKVEYARRPEVTVQHEDIGGRPCSVSVCEWANGEGWDVAVRDSAGQERLVSLHADELRALNAAVTMLDLRPEEDDRGAEP